MSHDDEWVNKDVRVPKGARLSSSHDTPDAERALLFDEAGNNLGPAELRDPQNTPDSGKELAALAVGALITLVVVKGPEIKRGLDEKVLPAVKAKWKATFKTRRADSRPAATEDASSDVETGRDASAGPTLTLLDLEADKPHLDRDDQGFGAPAA